MSNLSTITILYVPRQIQFKEVVASFLSNGWNIDDHGAISYIPLGSNDVSQWYRSKLDKHEQILKILEEKEKKGELIGLVIMWKESGIGCSLLFHEVGKLTFGLNVNRKFFQKNERLTDVNWYIKRLIPPLVSVGSKVVSIKWEENI